MIGQSRRGRHAAAATTMLLGSATVFGFVLLMNEYQKPPAADAKEAVSSFVVEKEKKKPPERPRPKPKPKKPERSTRNRTPVPRLAASIADVAIDVPGFDSSDLGDLSEKLLGETRKQMVMDEGSVDEPPQPISRVPPDEYPRKARQSGIEGYVTMSVLIGESGDVERVKVLEAKPPGVFDEVAIATIRKWRFAPATYQGEQVRVWAKQTMRFQLN